MEKDKTLDLNDRKYIIFGIFVVFLIFGVLLVWALTAKIDTVVIANGKVVLKSYKKPIEYKEWGAVTKVFVKEGDMVNKGEPLIELEKLEQDTNYKVIKAEYITLIANRDRLISEKNLKNKIF